jgi:hypothetical protein
MRKITLSAAILAMTMMGCSDAGLDNSVASTNDVKQGLSSENAVAFLKKTTSTATDFLDSYEWRTDINGMSFRFYGASEVEETSRKRGIGTFTVYTSDRSKIDVVNGVTLNVADCYYAGSSVDCRYVDWRVDQWLNVQPGQKVINQTGRSFSSVDRDRITTISYFNGVWHYGQNDEVVLEGSSYAGHLYEIGDGYMIGLIAQKYIQMAVDEYWRN